MKNFTNISRSFFQTAIFIALAWSISFNLSAAQYPKPGNFANGSKTWAENCGRCHNLRSPQELRDDQWVSAIFHMRVRGGLTGQETRDVITFLQASNTGTTRVARTNNVSSNDSAGVDGKTEYSKTCAACHGADGKGALPGVPNFTDKSGRLGKSDAELLNSINNGFQSPGSPMPMPPKGGNPNLTSKDVENLLKYIREAFGS